MIDRKSLLLLAVSTGGSLLLGEIALRKFTTFGPNRPKIAPLFTPVAASAQLDTATRYVAQLPAQPGTDRQWFAETPEPVKRGPIDKVVNQRYDEYLKRGFYPAASFYIYNRLLVENDTCGSGSPLRHLTGLVHAFEPPGQTKFPRFRFPPNMTTPSGLVTNQFGLRGPQIALRKPDRTIRVAFVGASTTVNPHSFAFSYPEYTVHWLNRFAAANHLDVRFEVLNAGREGLGSYDIAAIVREELLPLDPDLVVYYEGANQFYIHHLMFPPHEPRTSLDPKDTFSQHKVPQWFLDHTATGEALDQLLGHFVSAGEPVKPFYRVRFPRGQDENHPDVDRQGLPMDLPAIIRDLDSIRESLKPIGGELVVASFSRLAVDRLLLSPTQHHYIYEQLNTVLWPFRYADIRRLSDFQNRVFQAYAQRRQVPFLDIAGEMPQVASLFSDSVHMIEVGERLKAWIAFQQLIPLVRQRIESGRLPRVGPRPPLPPPPSLQSFEIPVCTKATKAAK